MQNATHVANGVVVFIDQQKFALDDRPHTPRELLILAGEDPSETTLVRKHGHELDKLTDLDKPIDVKNGEHFVVYHNEPTPGVVMYGLPRLLADLRGLGYSPAELTAPDGTKFAMMSQYEVECGRFVGRTIDLAVQATPDFPMTVSSAIHVRASPQLYERGDNVANVRNIADSVLGPEWCYWSNNFGWTNERTARRLMSQINGIFLRAA